MKKNIFNKILAVVLAVSIGLFGCGISVFAEDTTCPIKSVNVIPLRPMYENIDGHEDEGFFYYDFWAFAKKYCKFDLELEDGSRVTCYGREELEDYGLSFSGMAHGDGNHPGNPLYAGCDPIEVSFDFHHIDSDTYLHDDFTMEIVAMPIESISAMATKPLTENAAGTKEWGSEGYYYVYNLDYCEPEFTVKWKDSSRADEVFTVADMKEAGFGGFEYITDQGEGNVWGVGTHTAQIGLFGVTSDEFEVNVVSSNIASVSVKATTDNYLDAGCYERSDIGDDGEPVYWKEYDFWSFSPEVTVTYENGFSVVCSLHELNNKTGLDYGYSSDQSYNNEWDTAGDYEFGVRVYADGGPEFNTVLSVKLVENPIESISAVANGYAYITDCYEQDTEYGRYNVYNYNEDYTFTVKYTNGETKVYSSTEKLQREFKNRYYLYVDTNQSFENQWQVGDNKVTIDFLGRECECNIKLLDRLVNSVRVVETPVLNENTNGYIEGDNYIYNYDYYPFKLEFELFSGEIVTETVDSSRSKYGEISYSDNQIENPWTPEGENTVNVTFTDKAGVVSQTTCNITIKSQPQYSYYMESEDEVVISGYMGPDKETVTVPSEINGYTVVGITDFGRSDIIKKVVLPDTLTQISDNTFSGLTNLEEIVFGSGIKNISETAFFEHENLKAITVSEDNPNYTSVNGVLYSKDLTKLVACPLNIGQTVMLPNETTDISVLFTYNKEYGNIRFGYDAPNDYYVTEDGVTYNREKTFIISCDSEKSGKYVMPDTVTKVREYAFDGCKNLTEVTISNKVTDIAYGTFANCTSLSKVNLPENLKTVGESAFGCCTSLTNIPLPNKVETIGQGAFYESGIKSITLPDSIKTVGPLAFSYTPLKTLNLGKGVEVMDSAFEYCSELTAVTIPSSVTSFNAAFLGCDNLSKVTLSNGLKIIGDRAFMFCGSLEGITIPSTVTDIWEFAFAYTGLKSIIIPNSVTYLGSSVFHGCKSLVSATIGSGVEEISNFAFYGCPLKTFKWGGKVSRVGVYALSNNKLTSLEVPNTVTNILYGAYAGSSNLSSIKIPSSVKQVGAYAFDGTAWYNKQPNGATYLNDVFYKYKGTVKNQTSLSIKTGTRVIADGAFENSNLKSVTIPNTVEYIGIAAFNGMKNLKEITIPDSVKEIGVIAFTGSNVETVNIGKSVKYLGIDTFAVRGDYDYATDSVVRINSIKAVNVSKDNPHYTSIDGVLYNKDVTELIYCPPAKTGNLIVPASVNYIRNNAFAYSSLDSVTFLNDNVRIDYYAFNGYYAQHEYFTNCHLMVDYYLTGDEYLPTVKGRKNSAAEDFANMNGFIQFTAGTDLKKPGDVNADANVSLTDLVTLARINAGWENVTYDPAARDINGDGKTDLEDITYLAKCLANWQYYSPCDLTFNN